MIWIWIFSGIVIVMLLLALALGLARAAALRWGEPEHDEITEKLAEEMTRPNGNVEVLPKEKD